jgi:hypothetical protein
MMGEHAVLVAVDKQLVQTALGTMAEQLTPSRQSDALATTTAALLQGIGTHN